MTGAQNAGRLEAMRDAVDMGIKEKKKWIATLDSRTRDAHADLDGQVQEIEKPFQSALGDIMCPGDPAAHPGNVWNCRCTLGWVYDEYPEQYSQRRAYVEYVDDEGKYHRESHEIENISYKDWKLVKDRDNQRALEAWRTTHNVVGASALSSGWQKWNDAKKQKLPTQFETDKKIFEEAGIEQIEGERTFVEDMWRTNPDYDVNDPATTENCQRCVLGYVARRKGFNVEAQKIYNMTSDYLMYNNGWKRAFGGDPGFTPIFKITDKDIDGQRIHENIKK